MSALPHRKLITVEDYLHGELASPVKHEYLGGVVHAMPGARNAHNLIAGNILISLGSRLRGKPCWPYNSDTKIRVRLPNQIRFYYPDVSVICRPNPQSESFQDEPAVIFEVLSGGTRRIDEGEKKDAYLSIASLNAYVLVEQETASVTVFRRTATGFVREVHEGHDAVLPIGEIDADLPLSEIYDAVEFSLEPSDDPIA